MTKERPIILKAHEVRAILEGRQSQLRRVMKFQPGCTDDGLYVWSACQTGYALALGPRPLCEIGKSITELGLDFCPYGQPGDRLWVRETHAFDVAETPPVDVGGNPTCKEVFVYKADSDEGIYRWRPSPQMPRWASRILLEIVSVRVERLQDISEHGCYASGVECWSEPGLVHFNLADERSFKSAYDAYRKMWSNEFGPGNWDANPWVWVVEFKRIKESPHE